MQNSRRSKNLLEINHRKDDCVCMWLCLSRKLWNECGRANPFEWITQDNNKGTSVGNTVRQFPFVFCITHRWNALCDDHIFAHHGLCGTKSIGSARQQTGTTIFPQTSSLALWLLLQLLGWTFIDSQWAYWFIFNTRVGLGELSWWTSDTGLKRL